MQQILDWMTANKDALSIICGSGIIFVIFGALIRFLSWILASRRKQKLRTNSLPFKLIYPNSNVAKEIMGGDDNNPLADKNIPYQQRVEGKNIRREIEDLLEKNRWVLIVGRTGLGKTREATLVAESLNKEGWTVLNLTRERWLEAPAHLPSGIPERKLLFLLDDLNRKIYASHVEQSPKAENSISPLTIPLQSRLQETMETFELLCGRKEIYVLATARNEMALEFQGEPSEWQKLEFEKYHSFWKKFAIYELSEPSDYAEVNLIQQSAKLAKIKVAVDDLNAIASRNDGTFGNLVENIRVAYNQNQVFSLDTFRDTLQGTWEKRYKEVLQKYPQARYIYDAIELLRYARLDLTKDNTIQTSILLFSGNLFNKIRTRWKIIAIFSNIEREEEILRPRDGQIEAKGYRLDLQKYLPYLYSQVINKYYSKSSTFRRFNTALGLLIFPKKYILKENFSFIDMLLSNFFNAGHSLSIAGHAYIDLGFIELGIHYLKQSIKINSPEKFRWLYKLNTKERADSYGNLGSGYFRIGQLQAAIEAYKTAIKLNSRNANYWRLLGNVFSELGQHKDAEEAFQTAIKLKPKETRTWIELGILYSELRQYDEALSSHLKAIALKPKDIEAWIRLAEFYRTQNRYNESLQAAERAVEIDPKSAYAWNQLGCIYADQANISGAIDSYIKGIQIKASGTIWCNLGIIYLRENRYDEAVNAFQNSLSSNPKSVYSHLSLATYYIKHNRVSDAEHHIKESELLLSHSLNYYKACNEALRQDVDGALNFLRLSLKRHETSIAWARNDPNFDRISDNPGFLELVKGEK